MQLEKTDDGIDLQKSVKKNHLRVVVVYLCIKEKELSKKGCSYFLSWMFKDGATSKNLLGGSKFGHLVSKKDFEVEDVNNIKEAFESKHRFVDKMLNIVYGFGINVFLNTGSSQTPDKPKSQMEAKRAKELNDELFNYSEKPLPTRTKSSEISRQDKAQLQRNIQVVYSH